MRKTVIGVALCGFALVVLSTGLGEVAAQGAPGGFAGKVVILKKRPPSYFSSKGAFTSFLRNNSTKIVYENEKKEWVFETMSFFKKPLGDYEVEMVFFDIERGRSSNQRRFVDSFTQYTQDRNTRSLAGKAQLLRPQFDANTRYMVIAQSHGRDMAIGEFATKGTSQAYIDQQKRYEATQREMEKSMLDLERRAKEQEERNKKANKKAADDLF
jgi:hypothetical protein